MSTKAFGSQYSATLHNGLLLTVCDDLKSCKKGYSTLTELFGNICYRNAYAEHVIDKQCRNS